MKESNRVMHFTQVYVEETNNFLRDSLAVIVFHECLHVDPGPTLLN